MGEVEPTANLKLEFMKLTEVTNAASQANLITRPIYIDIAKIVALHREGNRFTRIRFSGDVKNSIDVTESIEYILTMPTPMISLAATGETHGEAVAGLATKVGEVSNRPIKSDSEETVDADMGRGGRR